MITAASTDHYAKREAGSKGYDLYLLTREGFPVPEWVVLEAKVFRLFRNLTGISSKIQEILKPIPQVAIEKQVRLIREAERVIRNLIIQTPLPREIDAEVRNAYSSIQGKNIAIRPSVLGESPQSFPGIGFLEKFLFICSEEEAFLKLKECWASVYSAQSLLDRLRKRGDLKVEPQLAVVFQEMVASEKSGIAYTCEIREGDPTRITVHSILGIEKKFRSKLSDGDFFLLDKETGQLLEERIGQKNKTMNSSELRQLAEICRSVEKFYQFPQDIEWGWKEGRFFIFQTRPVSSQIKDKQGHLGIWDDSASVEGYSGVSSPLTFSVARHLAHSFYSKLSEVLVIPRSEVRRLEPFLRNLLGIFQGRIFSNLMSEYKATWILPGFKWNRRFFEDQMGIDAELPIDLLKWVQPSGWRARFYSRLWRLFAGVRFVFFSFSMQTKMDEFFIQFAELDQHYRQREYSRIPADQTYELWKEFEAKVFENWKAPILNETLSRIYFGILSGLTRVWLGPLGNAWQNQLFCGDLGADSGKIVRELVQLAGQIKRNPSLGDLIIQAPAEDCMEKVMQSPYDPFKKQIEQFLQNYGSRSTQDRKFEKRDFYSDPSFIYSVLKNYLKAGQTDLSFIEFKQKKIRTEAEQAVASKLSKESLWGWKNAVYFYWVEKVRRSLVDRENAHFCLSRFHSVLRKMFLGIGKEFSSRKMLEFPEDIFFLEMEEVAGALEGTLSVSNLMVWVEVRKREYSAFSSDQLPTRLMTRGPVYSMRQFQSEQRDLQNTPYLKGWGVFPGCVEGRIKLMRPEDQDFEVQPDEILVLLNPDPGWSPLFPLASALLIERGGTLSHSAVLARQSGLPTVVGVKDLTARLKSGMRVRVHGDLGLIEILSSSQEEN